MQYINFETKKSMYTYFFCQLQIFYGTNYYRRVFILLLFLNFVINRYGLQLIVRRVVTVTKRKIYENIKKRFLTLYIYITRVLQIDGFPTALRPCKRKRKQLFIR